MNTRHSLPQCEPVCPVCKKSIGIRYCDHFTDSGRWLVRYLGGSEFTINMLGWNNTTVVYMTDKPGERVLKFNGYILLDDEKIDRLLVLK